MHLSWLHITDFHAGQGGQQRLWPQAQQLFFERLPELHRESGPWDLILFTGDLAFSGQPDQYAEIDALLQRLIEAVSQWQDNPPLLLAVPGNHDLDRDMAKAAGGGEGLINHRHWADDAALQQNFWRTESNSIRQAVSDAFAEYDAWWQRQPASSDPPPGLTIAKGVLPGDFGATLEKDGVPFGILGLNSAFLQLTGEDYQGKLGLGLEQFHAACGGDGAAWAARHCACLLLTHHPWDWLAPQSKQNLVQEILGGKRFALHLCGHMHETHSLVQRTGGGEPRRLFQARSLFGLEKLGNGIDRRHGCVAGRLQIDNSADAHWRAWPRKYHLAGDDWDIIPDPDIKLDRASGGTLPDPFDPRPGCFTARAAGAAPPTPDPSAPPDPDPDLPRALAANLAAAPALASHLCRRLGLPAAADPAAALAALPPEQALGAFWGAAHDCREDQGNGCWTDGSRDPAVTVLGLLLGRFVRARRPEGSLALLVRLPPVSTEVGAEVLWLHWHGRAARPAFRRWGGRLIGVHNVLGGISLPATGWNSTAQRIHDAKAALWTAVFSGTKAAPPRFEAADDQALKAALAFETEYLGPKHYGTVDPRIAHDPLGDPVVLAALRDDIGLKVFEIDPGAEPLFCIDECTFMLRVAQCWPTFEGAAP